ncbi:MAG: efflux RND transporter periplasmic adaptor subunit [Woeseiaceae bacterium]|jgi:multidrug efflux system membrane fusion protein|nr:efflux RND transporter periplasmic adaptor subunit [Woeseiaceae bacterium]
MKEGILSTYKSWLTSAGIALAIAAWLMSGQIPEDEAVTLEPVGIVEPDELMTSVRIRTQSAEEVTRTITVNGKTAPARIVEINAETNGRVVATGVARGERLEKGDVIVTLDERDRLARLTQARAMVKQRELEFAARDRLKDESYVSEAQLQEAAAQLEMARAELARAELDIEYRVIRAPFDGALQDRMVEIGDYLKSGDPVAIFVDDRKLIVSADISEFDANHVMKGNGASARLATGELVEGTIRYVAPIADEATRTFRVELEVDNAAGIFRGGVSAEMMIPAETIYAHKISPSLLTLDDEGNLGIKTVNDEGKVEFFLADIAMYSNEGVWIAGLPHSASIITVGQGFVNAGAYVNSVPEVEINTAVATKTEQSQ